jgi:hypothetical protein
MQAMVHADIASIATQVPPLIVVYTGIELHSHGHAESGSTASGPELQGPSCTATYSAALQHRS